MKHAEDPDEDAAVPGLQAVQDPTLPLEKYPGAQDVHTVAFSRLYVPRAHGSQLALPAVELNDPARHGVHAEAPIIDVDPAGHATQADAPLCGIYVPGAHFLQSVPAVSSL